MIVDPNRSLLGFDQEAWLYAALSGSQSRGARWRFIGQQVMMAQLAAPGTNGATTLNPDQWDGYAPSRQRLFRHLADNYIDNTVVLTGDIHSGWCNDLAFNPWDSSGYNPITGKGVIGVEFVSPAISSPGPIPNPAEAIPTAGALRATSPHMKYVDLYRRGYVLIDADPERVQGEIWHVPTIDAPSPGETYSAGFANLAGANGLQVASGPSPSRHDVDPAWTSDGAAVGSTNSACQGPHRADELETLLVASAACTAAFHAAHDDADTQNHTTMHCFVGSRRWSGVHRMNAKVVSIRRATVKDAQRISELAQAIALQFIVDEFSAKGRALYLQELAPEVIVRRLADKGFHFLVAEDGEALVGVAAMQSNWHLYHLFVAKVDQRGGLARRLWQILRDEALNAGPPRSFKANVPRYAVAAYTRLGFKADGAMRDEKGVRFQLMTCPAKRLGAASAK